MINDVIGCGDSGCVFGRGPGTRFGGQHTNGGCRCLDGPGERMDPVRRRLLRRWIRTLRQQRDEARAEVERLRGWVVNECGESACENDAVPGTCSEAPDGLCSECCPMHRCGGEA